MLFKGVNLNPGDLVQISSKTLPIPSIRGAVLSIRGAQIKILSTGLHLYGLHTENEPRSENIGSFNDTDIYELEKYQSAEIAIPQHTADKHFSKNQKVRFSGEVIKELLIGPIVAAFDEFVVAKLDNGKIFQGHIKNFTDA